MKNKKIVIIISTILILAVIGVLVFIFINNNSINKYNSSKLNGQKDFVYNAEYKYEVAQESYKTEVGDTYSVKDIVVPFININSPDVAVFNEKIKTIYDELIAEYKDTSEGPKIMYVTSNYKTYVNGNILSVILTVTSGGTDVPQNKYYTYNIDLENLRSLEFADTYKIAGIKAEEIDAKVKNKITEYINNTPKVMWESGYNKDVYITRSNGNYLASVKDGLVQFFLNEHKKFCVIVEMEVPAGSGRTIEIIELQ